MKLSPRLAALADLAGSGGSLVDVGTDHGRLPVFMALEGRFHRIAASDIRPGPLQSARTTAREHGVEGKIEFYLSDGLREVPGPFDTVVIAGMGGETIVDILSNCHWADRARLALQPQSKLRELSDWLDGHGFVCRRARLTEDNRRLYAAFLAQGGSGGFDLLSALAAARDPLLGRWLARERSRLDRALSGMDLGDRRGSGEYDRLRRELETVEKHLLEVQEWQR